MEGTQSITAPTPLLARIRPLAWSLLVLAVLAIVVVGLAAVTFLPAAPRTDVPGPPLSFGTPAISGNRTSGWTYSLSVTVYLPWERPTAVVWGNLSIGILNSTDGRPLPFPSGTTLRVLSPANVTIAVDDVPTAAWRVGSFVLVADGQTLVLKGMIPPGNFLQNGTMGYVTGTSLSIAYANDGHPNTVYVALAS